MSLTRPTLWVVATPLGNLSDLSPRAREVLGKVDLVLAEDTRRAGILCKNAGIEAKRFRSLFEHNEADRIPGVIRLLEEGNDVAVISDAGTPLLSDPGYRLVRACRDKGIRVAPVPGPSAPLVALSACGLPPHPFTFLGFLPRKEGDVRRTLASYGSVQATLVFFERKSRVRSTLELAHEILGDREFCVARELTKVHEEFILGNLADLSTLPDEFKGELTIVIGPPEQVEKTSEEDILELAAKEAEQGGKPRQIARRVAENVEGWSVKAVYDFLLKNKE